jgi:Zn-dependent oligopeptidase
VVPECSDKRERLGAVKKRLSELGTEFSKALNEDNTKEAFTRDELAGMPEDYIDALEKVCATYLPAL